ncbi:MAG: hypothetical protein ACYTGV_02165 [Planctomycetota bacterium]|jgi:hypothetical protein
MLRCVLILLLAAGTAAADKAADRIINRIMDRFDVVLKDPVARKAEKESADSLCIRYLDHIKMCGKSTARMACTKLSKGFDPKYQGDKEFHACLAKLLASSGKPGVDALYRVYRKSSKRDGVRCTIVVALGNCRECYALDVLRKMMLYEKSPEVLAQVVRACGRYNREKCKIRKSTMEQLLRRYKRLARDASRKPADSREARLYVQLKPALDEALSSLSGGAHYESARDWECWMRTAGPQPSARSTAPASK